VISNRLGWQTAGWTVPCEADRRFETKRRTLIDTAAAAGAGPRRHHGGRRRRERYSDAEAPASASPITPSRRPRLPRAPRFEHCDLTALLFAQGYARSEWELALGSPGGSCRR
jgi:hypothetical protein